MKKITVLLLTAVMMIALHTKANGNNSGSPNNDDTRTGAGLLLGNLRGTLSAAKIKDVLDAFVRFNPANNDIDFLKKYVHTDIQGWPLEDMRGVIIEQLVILAGKDPLKGETITEDEAHAIIDALEERQVQWSMLKQQGYRSLFFKVDGSGQIDWWIPNDNGKERVSELILYYGERPAFSRYCVNPIIHPTSPEVHPPTEHIPTEAPLVTPPSSLLQGTGGLTINNINTNTNTNTNSTPQQPAVRERRGNNVLGYVAAAMAGYLLSGSIGNRSYAQSGYQQRMISRSRYNNGYRPSGMYRPPQYHPPVRPLQPTPRIFNSSSLDGRLPIRRR